MPHRRARKERSAPPPRGRRSVRSKGSVCSSAWGRRAQARRWRESPRSGCAPRTGERAGSVCPRGRSTRPRRPGPRWSARRRSGARWSVRRRSGPRWSALRRSAVRVLRRDGSAPRRGRARRDVWALGRCALRHRARCAGGRRRRPLGAGHRGGVEGVGVAVVVEGRRGIVVGERRWRIVVGGERGPGSGRRPGRVLRAGGARLSDARGRRRGRGGIRLRSGRGRAGVGDAGSGHRRRHGPRGTGGRDGRRDAR